ncbi:hypothetical protein [Cerasicoccus maritimus]|uniref:hypothetical protein n=1 Tax=Cerasicoccus maritimus TaxID=490089 RepID=UPI002852B4D5|nr:hypothetical protein [Cerasicoccus maritimus]
MRGKSTKLALAVASGFWFDHMNGEERFLPINNMSELYHYDELPAVSRSGFHVVPKAKFLLWAKGVDELSAEHANVFEKKEGDIFLFDGEPINPEQVR